ncbi:putative ribonuclease H protein [Vitis vinifera]|uniref:Putative ribonuclease H protein n=1 Tax=Vitis vinifera TaxID=29760 RepID=A0A438CWA5_VITVI|nr:putative ribonuclease H protein [Vitis vinifera]
MERKTHLVKWGVVCGDKENGGLGIRKFTIMNKALLGKWTWRFASDKEALWKHVLEAKYGQEDHGWRTKKAVGACGVGVWKEILKEAGWCWNKMGFKVGKGNKISFWTDVWCGDSALSQRFPHLYILAANRNAKIEELWDQNVGEGGWNLRFIRDFNDSEVVLVGELLQALRVLGFLGRMTLFFGKEGEVGSLE